MYYKLFLLTALSLLGYGFWISSELQDISAGVAIFLFGMLALENGFKAFTGGVLETILRNTTNKLWKSLSFGIISTTLMQSSSLVSVITISFLSAGLLELYQGIGIIFGANIGTTTGAWLVAAFGLKVKISAYAMPMIVFGVILLFQKSNNMRGLGQILVGIGFLFLGIHHMKTGFEAFEGSINLMDYAITGYPGLFAFTGIGILATIVMQSSHATLVLTITALASGHVTYENALALAIGANVGTTITAIIGALSANIAGKRLALAHLLFNLITGIIAIVFIHQFLIAVEFFSAKLGIAADDYTLKLAIFHTLFNVTGVLVMLPWMRSLVTFLEKFIRDRKASTARFSQPRYLTDSALDYPDTAYQVIKQETRHLLDNAFLIIAHGMNLHRHDILSNKALQEVAEHSVQSMNVDISDLYQRRVKTLYSAIIEYSARAQKVMLPEQIEQLYKLKIANRDIVDAIKDMQDLQHNMETYISAKNPHIRNEYNKIRIQLANILREIFMIEDLPPEERSLLRLDKLRLDMEKSDIVANGTLDHLIRDKLISDKMATSLMNDTAYAYNISKSLIHAAAVLFALAASKVKEDEQVHQTETELGLTDAEIENFLSQQKAFLTRTEQLLNKRRHLTD